MKLNSPSAVLVGICSLLFGPNALASEDGYQKGQYRIGLGYDVSSDLRLGAPLPSDNGERVKPIKCPKGALLSSTLARALKKPSELLVEVEGAALFGWNENVQCGQSKMRVPTCLELKRRDGSWKIIRKPSDRALRFYTKKVVNALAKRSPDGSIEHTEDGYKLRFKKTDLSTHCRIFGAGFVCAYRASSAQHRADLRHALQSMGYSLLEKPGDLNLVIVNYGLIKSTGFVESIRQHFFRSIEALSLYSSLEVKRAEQDLGERLPRNWREKEARRAFSGC